MLDRQPTKPNRYAVYDDAHNFLRYEYHERADEPTQVGDALNKANLLPDAVATALGLTGNPQVKDALGILSGAVNPLQYVWDKYAVSEILGSGISLNIAGTDTSTGTNTVTYGDSYSYVNKQIVINNPTTLNIGYSSGYSSSLLQNKIFTGNALGGKFYKGTAGTVLSSNYSSNAYRVFASNVQLLTISADYIGQVSSYSNDTYPQNNMLNEYYYEYLGRPQYIDARIATGSYTGTGTYGSSNPNSVILGFIPKLFICGNEGLLMIAINPYGTYILIKGTQNGYNSIQFGSTVKWNNSYSASCQLNDTGTKFYYAAIG